MISDPKQQEITAYNYFNCFASVAQKLFSNDFAKFKFQNSNVKFKLQIQMSNRNVEFKCQIQMSNPNVKLACQIKIANVNVK